MTLTGRWVVAQKRKRQVISQTLRDRVRTDPRRTGIHPEREKSEA
jgi:hypothetical protein